MAVALTSLSFVAPETKHDVLGSCLGARASSSRDSFLGGARVGGGPEQNTVGRTWAWCPGPPSAVTSGTLPHVFRVCFLHIGSGGHHIAEFIGLQEGL